MKMPSSGKTKPRNVDLVLVLSWTGQGLYWIPQQELAMHLEYINLTLTEVYRLGTQLALYIPHPI